MEQTTDPIDKSSDKASNHEQKKESNSSMPISDIKNITKNGEAVNSQAQIKNLSNIQKKKIRTYLFEFLMLFLAVFCGFMADNIREQLSEKQREKIFIKSIVEDIKSDTLESNTILEKLKIRQIGIESVIVELMSSNVSENSNNLYKLWTENLGLDVFVSNDRTIQQLKSSGELRLIRNKTVSDRIMKYDQILKKYYTQSNMMYNAITNVTSYSDLFDFISLNKKMNVPVPLTKQGKVTLNQAYGHLYLWSRGLDGLIGWLEVVNKEAKDLVVFIKEEYNLN
jgi:hypothetical protein